MTRLQLLARLRSLDACSEAVEWLKASDHQTLQEAWDACERADWLLWLAAHMDVDGVALVNAACDCAATALPVWEKSYPDDKRPHQAIERARQYVAGQCDLAALTEARDAAWAAWAAARAAALKDMAALVRKRIPDPDAAARGVKP